MNYIWRSNFWPSSLGVQRFVWASNQITSIMQGADPVHPKASTQAGIDEPIVQDNSETPSSSASTTNIDVGPKGVLATTEKIEIPPFIDGKPFFEGVSGLLCSSDSEKLDHILRGAVSLAWELPRQTPFVLLKTLPMWSQALFHLMPLADPHQSKTLFEALVSCIDVIKHASDTNHEFIQSVLSDWITWSVSTFQCNADSHDPLYVVLLREFVRLTRPWLAPTNSSLGRSFHHCHTAALSVADIILSLISKLAASTNGVQPRGISQAWGHVSKLAASLGSLIATGDRHVVWSHVDPAKDAKEQPPRDLSNYLNVCSAFAEFMRSWFSLGQRGTTAQACFTFCRELCLHDKGDSFIVYFWKRFCSEATDTPFLFPPAYPDISFPLFHWTGPASRSAQRVCVVGTHISKAGVENTPIASVAFNICSGMLLKGSSNGTSLGLCIVNAIIGASCDFEHPSTAAVIRSSAASLLERLLFASAPFISLNHSKDSQAVTNFFSLVARTLTCVSDADWEQYWLQEIDKQNISLSSSFMEDSRRQLPSNGAEHPMSLFGWLKAMLIVAFKENQGLDSETGAKNTSVDQIDPYPTSKFLNYSGKLDDEVKFSLAMCVSNGLHVLLEHLKSEKFLQRLEVSETKTHFFDLMLLDDSAKITGIVTGQISSQSCTLFEGTWSLLLHLHFILVCSQNSFEYKSHLFELPTGEARRLSVTSKQSMDATANAKQLLENRYSKQAPSEAHFKLHRNTKNIYIAIHCSLKLLLDQSVHCLFVSSSHDVLSCRYRNRIILQIFLEGTNMNQYDSSEFSFGSTQVSSNYTPSLSSPVVANDLKRSQSAFASVPSVSLDFFVSDEAYSVTNPPASLLSQASTSIDSVIPPPFITPSPSEEDITPVANEMMLSRGASGSNEKKFSRDSQSDPLLPLRAPVSRPALLRSLETLCDQGNIKFLTDFMLMYIREDFRLNSSNLFASR
jgi:hypothetical protein